MSIPQYSQCGALVQERAFPNVPTMALTATATSNVKQDIQRSLHISGACAQFQVAPHTPLQMLADVRRQATNLPTLHAAGTSLNFGLGHFSNTRSAVLYSTDS